MRATSLLLLAGCAAASPPPPVVAPSVPAPPPTAIYQLNAVDEGSEDRLLGPNEALDIPAQWIARADATSISGLHARGFRSFDFSEERAVPDLPADTERLAASAFPAAFPAKLSWLELKGTKGVAARCAEIAALPLVRIGLADTDADDACVTLLSQCASLERIDLTKTKVSDAGVHSLVALPLLSAIVLSGTKVTDTSVSILLDHFALKRLDVGDTSVKRATKIARTTSFERLDLSGTHVSTKIVAAIVRHPYLQWLSLADVPVNDKDLATLAQALPRLEALDLSGSAVSSLVPLAALHRLSLLAVAGTLVSDLRPLAHAFALRYLDIGGTLVEEVSSLRGLQALHTLSLKHTAVTDLSPLLGLSSLTHLVLERVAAPSLQLSALRSLVLLNVDDTAFSDADLAALPDTLIALHLARTSVRALDQLGRFSRLRTLDVSNLPLTPKHVAAWRFRDLRVLNASYTPLADLSGLPRSLRRLYLVGTPVAVLPPRADLPLLEHLDLRETVVGDPMKEQWLGAPR